MGGTRCSSRLRVRCGHVRGVQSDREIPPVASADCYRYPSASGVPGVDCPHGSSVANFRHPLRRESAASPSRPILSIRSTLRIRPPFPSSVTGRLSTYLSLTIVVIAHGLRSGCVIFLPIHQILAPKLCPRPTNPNALFACCLPAPDSASLRQFPLRI
jgi:hypothetical protein